MLTTIIEYNECIFVSHAAFFMMRFDCIMNVGKFDICGTLYTYLCATSLYPGCRVLFATIVEAPFVIQLGNECL